MHKTSPGDVLKGLGLAGVLAATGCGTSGAVGVVQATESALSGSYDWPQFYGNAQHSGNNTFETQLTAANVNGLGQLFQAALPGTVDGAPAILTQVSTSSGTRDLAFVTTTAGHIVALDAHTGATIWSHQYTGPNFTTSSAAVDPSRAYVYSYGLDGYVHKYAVGTGVETTTGGWPEVATLKPSIEKGSTSLAITTVGTHSYLYIGYSGYGDGGDYQGHLTTVNLSTGAQTVFNSNCSNEAVHFTTQTDAGVDCPFVQSAIWGRSAAVYDVATNKIYAGTGNGTFQPSTFQWGDTVLALNPDGTGTAGGPLDSYTPASFATLQSSDLDLGSASPAILPGSGAVYPDIALQSGKDGMLRIINLGNLSGKGTPGQVGGELYSLALPAGNNAGNTIANGMPVWTNPADESTWVFVASYSGNLIAYKLLIDGNGNPSLAQEWLQAQPAGVPGGSLIVANGVLYSAIDHTIRALNPTTGATLWSSSSIGTIHWQSPVVANGVVYIADNSNEITAYSLGQATLSALPRTGWVATASASAGGNAPSNALDGLTSTRWSTGAPQASGQWFEVDMLTPQAFSEVTLDAAGSTNDYPRGYQVYVSNDGSTWGTPVATGAATSALVPISFGPQIGRYVKIIQTGAASNWWSIAELNVYGVLSSLDGGIESGADASADSSVDAAHDATADAGEDATIDSGRDGAADASLDADAGPDGATDGGSSALLPLPRSSWSVSANPGITGTDAAANAIDGSLTTRFSTDAPMTAGMYYDVNFGSAQTFSEITLDTNGAAGDSPVGYSVTLSNDGANWGSAVATGTGTTALVTISMLPQTAQYVRITQTGTSTHWWSIAELNFWSEQSLVQTTVGGSHTALSRAAWTASSFPTSTELPANALDGNEATRFSTDQTQSPWQYFQVNMGGKETFTQVTIDAGGNAGDYPHEYEIYVSNDGATWGSPIATGIGAAQLITVQFPAQTAQYVRVYQVGESTNWWSMSEFNVLE
jgi:F5/8 type C domain-containing protein/putative pyrroloquinoline-quinone binding quinoprotein